LPSISATTCNGWTIPSSVYRLAHDHRPDVILMDIQLRGPVDGFDAATEIQSALDIPVIFLTAYSDERSLRRAKESRAYGYILKPFQERELGITIDLALYKHAAERDVARSRQLLDVTVNSIPSTRRRRRLRAGPWQMPSVGITVK